MRVELAEEYKVARKAGQGLGVVHRRTGQDACGVTDIFTLKVYVLFIETTKMEGNGKNKGQKLAGQKRAAPSGDRVGWMAFITMHIYVDLV